jgi:hypothetical protein
MSSLTTWIGLLAFASLAACSSDDASEGASLLAGGPSAPSAPNVPRTPSDDPSNPTSQPKDSSATPASSHGGSTASPTAAGSAATKPANITRACTGTSTTTEHYDQPAPPDGPSGVSFLSDWSAKPLAGGFAGIQAVDACRYQLDPAFKTWHGKAATRIEVNPGDDPLGLGTERAEVLSMQTDASEITESSASGTQYFGLSYYFPTNWDATFLRGDGDSWSFVMQLHGDGSVVAGGLAAGRRTDTDKQHLWYSGGAGDVAFSDGGEILLGQWLDLVMEVDFKAGHLNIWRRNEGQTTFTNVVDSAYPDVANASGIYFKQGLYRGPDVNGRTDVFWIGPTSRGTSFASVEGASYGTSAGF